MKFVISFIKKSLMVSMLVPTLLFAQTEALPPSATSSTPGEILAQINVSHAEVIQEGDKTRINFLIENLGTKAESDLQYGIEIVKIKGGEAAQIDTQIYNVDETIMPKEALPVLVEYESSKLAVGLYEVWIMVRTPGGLTVGVAKAGEISGAATPILELKSETCEIAIVGDDNKYTIFQGVDFAASEEVMVSCEVKNNSETTKKLVPNFVTHNRTIYGDVVAVDYGTPSEVELPAGAVEVVTFSLPKAAKPQAYDLVVTFKEVASDIESNMAIIHYVLQGQSATVQSVGFDKASYQAGEEIKLAVLWSESADTFPEARTSGTKKNESYYFNIEIKDQDGVVCATDKKEVPNDSNTIIGLIAKTDCVLPTASVKVETASGLVLDSQDVSIKTDKITDTEQGSASLKEINPLMFVPIVMFGLVAIFGLLTYYRRKHDNIVDTVKSLVLLVVFGFSLFGNAAPAEAVTWGLYEQQQTGCNSEGECSYSTAHTFTGTVNTNKTTYSPGEQITMTGYMANHACTNASYSMTVGLNGEQKILANGQRSGWFNLWGTFNAPTTPGNYWLATYMCNSSSGACAGSGLWITVANPAINGSCSPAPYQCYAGSPVNGSGNATNYTWNCAGAYGGSSPSCSAPKPAVAGSCSATHFACTAGTSANNSNNATNYTWTCNGQNGGATASCTETKVNGSCGTTQNSCTAGTAVNGSQDANNYLWSCNSTNGGSNASCQVPIPPTVTLTANPSLIGPNSSSDLTWTSTYATACTASGAWSGSKALSGTDEVSPKAKSDYTISCTGPGGTANQTVTVRTPSGTISATPCTIPNEGTSCMSLVRWNSFDFLDDSAVYLGSSQISSLTNNTIGTNYEVTPSNRTFKLDDQGSSFETTAIADVSCATGYVWDSSLLKCVVKPQVDITITPDVIRSGNTANISLMVNSTYDLTCTLSGGINKTINHTGGATTLTYSATTNPLTAAQIVTATCTSAAHPDITDNGEGRVEVIPVIEET